MTGGHHAHGALGQGSVDDHHAEAAEDPGRGTEEQVVLRHERGPEEGQRDEQHGETAQLGAEGHRQRGVATSGHGTHEVGGAVEGRRAESQHDRHVPPPDGASCRTTRYTILHYPQNAPAGALY